MNLGTTRRPFLCLGLLLAVALVPTAAHAIAACTAADVVARDSACPAGTGPCTISRVFEVGDGCTLDFGTRAVTIGSSGELEIGSRSVTVRAGSFAVALGGLIDGGSSSTTGGMITIETTGAFTVQQSGTRRGVIDLTGKPNGGTLDVVAGAGIVVGGRLLVSGIGTESGGGTIRLEAAGDIVTQASSRLEATGGILNAGGLIDLVAEGRTDLGTGADVTGGEGGEVDVQASGEFVLRGSITGKGNGDAGSGGSVTIMARSVRILAPIVVGGTGSTTNSGGGCGGCVDIEATFGDLVIAAKITSDSGAPDGGGGLVDLVALGSVIQQAGADISAKGDGPGSFGGGVEVEAGLDVDVHALVDASGGFDGSCVAVSASRRVLVTGTLDARGRSAGGFGGLISIVADRGEGDVTISGTINSSGGGCGVLEGCGMGGTNDVEGCNVLVTGSGQLLSRGPDGGENDLTVRELLVVQGTVDATTTLGMANGSNRIVRRAAAPPAQLPGEVRPTATVVEHPDCPRPGLCLRPCPTCGDGRTQFPETCDQASNPPVGCDGCSRTCQVENCNDANPCTIDSCDPLLGCAQVVVCTTTTTTSSRTSTTRSTTSTTVRTTTTLPALTTTTLAPPPPTTSTTAPPGTTTTSIATTTSTVDGVTPTTSTTSTTIPAVLLCEPADCDDGNPCTQGSCTAGTCVQRRDDVAGANCEIERLPSLAQCGDGPVHAKITKVIEKKSRKAQKLLAKATATTKAKKRAKLIRKADKQLNVVQKRIDRGVPNRLTPECAAILTELVTERRQLIEQLGAFLATTQS